jgi:uncharacterized repeat protein (TIGR01451 family)
MKPKVASLSRRWPVLMLTLIITSLLLVVTSVFVSAYPVRHLLAAGSPPDPALSAAKVASKKDPSPPLFTLNAAGDTEEVFTNTWSYSTIGMVYDPDQDLVRYAHESQSSTHNPTVYDVELRGTPKRTVVYSFALSTENAGWPWQLDNRTGAGYDYETGTFFLPDYNGDLSYSDDNIVEIDVDGTILNAWEMDDEVGSNDSSDGSEIDSIIDIAVVPGSPTRYFATAAYDDNVVYEIALQKTGVWWTPNSWHTVATCTIPIYNATDDNLGIDYDAENRVLYHSSWDTTTLVLTDLTCNGGVMNLVDSPVKSFDCSGAGGYNTGVTFIEGQAEVWVTDFDSDKTTRCDAPNATAAEPGWEKIVDGTSWSSGLTVTTETSSTFQVTDVITASERFTLTELWDVDRLLLTGVSVEPPLAAVVTATGALTVTGDSATPDVVTVTKQFWTQPSTWAGTVVSEHLTIDAETPFVEQRPFTVTKLASQLSITSTYQPLVYAGGVANFTLAYTNTGGFENDVVITNTFPVTAPMVYADPEPDDRAMDGTWARWDVGDLATGDGGEVDVYVYISESLPAATEIPIWDGIYNHVGELADDVTTTFEIVSEAAAGWIKTIDGGDGPVEWSSTFSLTLETYDTFTVTDVITVDDSFSLVETWLTSELALADWTVDPITITVDDSVPGMLTMSAGPSPLSRTSGPITLTKVFTVGTCSWPQTVLGEALQIGGGNALIRPVLVHKTAPVLSMTAANPTPEIHGGETVTYTLTYSNTGGYENAFRVEAGFPNGAEYQGADPAPTTPGAPGDPTVTWVFTDGLATGDAGSITVTVQITDEVPPVTRFEIANTLFDHADVPKDLAPVVYEAGAPVWEKRVNDVAWSLLQRTAVEAGDLLTITDVITSEAPVTLVDRWIGGHLTLLAVTPGAGSVTSATGVLTWTMSAALDPVTLTKRFRVDPFTPTHTVLWENLVVGGTEWERRPVVLERLAPDLRLTKEVVPTTAAPGDAITYTLTFSNAGPGTARGVVLTDTLPVSVTVTSVVSAGVMITDTGATPSYVWEVADLASGAGGVITITGVLSDPLPAGLITNVAEIAADNEVEEIDTSPGGGTSDVTQDAATVAVDGDPMVCTLTDPISGTTYAFCNGICGDVTFVNTGTVSSLVITFTQHYPSINGEGLPRQYRISADGTGFTATLTLCYEDEELDVAGIPMSDEGELRGFRYTGADGIWEMPGSQSLDTGGNTVTIGGVNAFSAWGIGIPNTAEKPTAVTAWRVGGHPNVIMFVSAGLLALAAVGWILQRRRA